VFQDVIDGAIGSRCRGQSPMACCFQAIRAIVFSKSKYTQAAIICLLRKDLRIQYTLYISRCVRTYQSGLCQKIVCIPSLTSHHFCMVGRAVTLLSAVTMFLIVALIEGHSFLVMINLHSGRCIDQFEMPTDEGVRDAVLMTILTQYHVIIFLHLGQCRMTYFIRLVRERLQKGFLFRFKYHFAGVVLAL